MGGATVVGVTDFVASPDQREEGTLFGFTQPESTEGLTGRKKAAAIFRNKLRYGAEGTIVGGLFPIGGKAIQQTFRHIAYPTAVAMGCGGRSKGGGKRFSQEWVRCNCGNELPGHHDDCLGMLQDRRYSLASSSQWKMCGHDEY